MERIITYDKSNDRLTGILFILLFFSLLTGEITNVHIKIDVNGIHDSLKFIGNHYTLFLVNSIIQLINLVLYIALAASLYINLRFFNNTLSHFTSFGIAATGLTLMVSASGSLSLLNITKDYLISSGIEADIVSLNGLSIAELRKNAILITFTIEAFSIIAFGIYNIKTKSILKIISFSSIILGIAMVSLEWVFFGKIIFIIVRYLVVINYLCIGYLYLKKGKQ